MSGLVESVIACFRERQECLATLGAVTAIYLTIKTSCALWSGFKQYVLANFIKLGVDFRSYGQWAVVTGSTDGIGKAYAHSLARAGLNVVLVSRTLDKLNAVAKEIEAKYNVKTKVLAIDFTGGAEIYTKIAQGLAGLDIGVLVNNVGMANPYPQYLLESDDQNLHDMINVNCISVTFMTKIVLPSMVEKRKGIVINISSMTAIRQVPLLSVYGASKAYVELFSKTIRNEYSSKGIIIQNVNPGFVFTKLAGIPSSNFISPTPDKFLRTAINTVGVADTTAGCLIHGIQKAMTLWLPEWIHVKVTTLLVLQMRSDGMKKYNKKE